MSRVNVPAQLTNKPGTRKTSEHAGLTQQLRPVRWKKNDGCLHHTVTAAHWLVISHVKVIIFYLVFLPLSEFWFDVKCHKS